MPESANEVRASFLEFFRTNNHTVVPSSPIVPANDPTLMFANAGMVQFKDVFTGKETRSYTRATSSQKCIRISGKHNDLENVGVTARHHTFFEMLGNFSFGDYFKEEAIVYAWDFLTRSLELPKDRLIISVFGGEQGVAADDEARAIWKKVTGFGDERIIGLGMKDNFWQMGETGPCGPCSEIHFFSGDNPDLSLFEKEPGADGRGWMEIWNLVFMQYNRREQDGGYSLDPLPAPCVDTGAGLERLTSVVQGKRSNYDTDLLHALVERGAQISGKTYGATLGDDDVSMRVIADHARTAAFLIAEGIFPDRAGREYVLRRVMRRAIRHGHRLGIRKPFLHEVALEVVNLMGGHFPELVERKELIQTVSEQEEVRFRETIERGLKILDEEMEQLRSRGETALTGKVAFKLYDTFGFPVDLTEVIVQERSCTIDMEGYERELEAQRLRSEGSKVGEASLDGVLREASEKSGTTEFVGYEHETGEGAIRALIVDGKLVERAEQGAEVLLVVDRTPFYAESGGQMGDRGVIFGEEFHARVTDTRRPYEGFVVHHGKVETGAVTVGAPARLEVDHAARTATRRNHSATHLLHWALRKVLGPQSSQKGSLVGPDRLRFDFSHGKGLTEEELRRIEDLVNEKIWTAAPVETQVLPIAEAKAAGAMAIFEEKYGDTVRVLTMTKDSVELCGGTHARNLGELGQFKILSEGGVAAGVRRIEAATGERALAHVRTIEANLLSIGRLLKSSADELEEKLTKLIEGAKAKEKEIQELKKKLALGGAGEGNKLDQARAIPGGKVLAVSLEGVDGATLRETAEKLRDQLGPSVVLAASSVSGKVALVVASSLVAQYRANDIVKEVAGAVGGSGGGRPDMAQAGGSDPTKLPLALERFYGLFPL